MATVNMNCVEFYNPRPALEASHAQLTKLVLNKRRTPLQPSKSPPGDAELARNAQDNDSLDESFPSLNELFQASRTRDIPQEPSQNHEPLHGSRHQVFNEGNLPTNPTTSNSVYVPGSTQGEPLIIEDDSDDESEAAGVASSDLLASIEDQDASECGLATQDTASTPSSLFGPSTPRDSEYPNADCFSKDGQQRPSFAELGSTFPVQVRRPSPNCSKLAETTGQDQIHQSIEKAIVDETRPSHYNPLQERAGGSCDGGSVCDIEDKLRQSSEEAEGSLPSNATHSQCNQMNQESQNNTEVRGSAREERLWEKMIIQQQCQQKEQEDEDDIEVIKGENKGPINYCQQIKERLQHQWVEDETIVVTPLSQDRRHSVKPYHEDSEDDEDEDVRPPRRRKRRRIESDATEIAIRKKVHTRSSTIAQAQTRTTRDSTMSQSSSADAESILGADYQEYPFQGLFKRVRIGRETTYNLEFSLLDLPDSFRPSKRHKMGARLCGICRKPGHNIRTCPEAIDVDSSSDSDLVESN